MESEVINFIKTNNMINENDIVGVAVSGGVDSMSLLHFLNNYKSIFKCEIVAITVDHMLRGEDSFGDVQFVKSWCRDNKIKCLNFSVDAGKLANDRRIGIEQGAREARYGIFSNLLKDGTVNKIALAHHISDQAETILMHLLRGAGLNGAGGMDPVRNEVYIRPFLHVEKEDILNYAAINSIKYTEDKTNLDNKYNRNFIRNVIMPLIKERWSGVEQNLINFASSCREDNNFILGYIQHGGTIKEKNYTKIPLVYFHYPESVINRIILECIDWLYTARDVERKHIELIKELALNENGKKLNLPNDIVVQKEYDYITIYKNEKIIIADVYPFKVGTTKFSKVAEIKVKKTKDFSKRQNGELIIDADKLPKNAVWRTRKNGDKITKFGGGTKPLRSFYIDKKIPNRLRDLIPVLAVDDEIYCVAGIEISDKVKITSDTTNAYLITKSDLNYYK